MPLINYPDVLIWLLAQAVNQRRTGIMTLALEKSASLTPV
jgi:hypothetical protein